MLKKKQSKEVSSVTFCLIIISKLLEEVPFELQNICTNATSISLTYIYIYIYIFVNVICETSKEGVLFISQHVSCRLLKNT